MSLEEYIEFCLYVKFIKEHITLDTIRYINESSTGTYEDHVKLVLYLVNDIEKQLEKDKNKERFVYTDLYKKFKNITCKKLEILFDDNATYSDVHTKENFDKDTCMFELTQIHLNKINKNFTSFLVIELAHELLHDFQDLKTYKKNSRSHFIDKVTKNKYIKTAEIKRTDNYLERFVKRIEYLSNNIETSAFISELENAIEYNISKIGFKNTLKDLEKVLKDTVLDELIEYKHKFYKFIYNVEDELDDVQLLFCKYSIEYNPTYINHDYKYIMNAYERKINRTLNKFLKKVTSIIQKKQSKQAFKEHKIF